MPLRCVIVDDNEPFLAAARALLEREGLTVVGVASTSADAVVAADRFRPDVVLVDVFLGEESGVELARRLVTAHGQRATVILISSHSETDLAELLAQSPAAGFVAKPNLSAAAIRGLLDGATGCRKSGP